jgi:hypothetical protein
MEAVNLKITGTAKSERILEDFWGKVIPSQEKKNRY